MKKRTPADYAQFAFRVPKSTDKAELMKRIDRLLKRYRQNQDEAELLYNKNDIIVTALNIGLRTLETRKINKLE